MSLRICWITLLLGASASAQLRQIDVSKLPQDERVRSAYSSLLPLESYAHEWSRKWNYEVPRDQVVSSFVENLHTLKVAETAAPQNEELAVLSGLVAHLAYNLDVQEAYELAIQSLDNARKLAPKDYRPDWFLGIHRCQSDDIKGGMEQFLDVENRFSWQELPIAFWNDYVNCATVAAMPAHTLRAVDRAVHLGAAPSEFAMWSGMAQKRYKSPDVGANYPIREAWTASEGKSDVKFSSPLCGIGFTTHGDWHIHILDVAKGICVETVESGPYPSHSGESVPTLLVLTRVAKPEETLKQFAQSILKAKYPLARPIAAFSCPAQECLSFDILDKNIYQSNGGGHFLAIVFAEESPEYPGLLFETPQAPPKEKSDGEINYYTAVEKLHRFPGTLYTVVMLDSNAAIFEKASADFRSLLKSVQLD
jgi:hypothetical protein